jgi:hypothetical protein
VELAISGNTLFVANSLSGTVGEYDATTGAAINANFITGLSGPGGLVVASVTPALSPCPQSLFSGTSRVLATLMVTALLISFGRTLAPVSVPSGYSKTVPPSAVSSYPQSL